jgi:hypothetical protein
MNPEGFRNLVDFLEVLRTPSSPWLPSEWAAQTLVGYLEGRFDPFWLVLLWSTAAGLVVCGAWLHRRLYARGYTKAQEGAESTARRTRVWQVFRLALGPIGLERREMILKDARVFFRDATQWSQLLVLGVLLFVYIYNIRVLPLQTSEALSRFLVSMVVFLNLGLAPHGDRRALRVSRLQPGGKHSLADSLVSPAARNLRLVEVLGGRRPAPRPGSRAHLRDEPDPGRSDGHHGALAGDDRLPDSRLCRAGAGLGHCDAEVRDRERGPDSDFAGRDAVHAGSPREPGRGARRPALAAAWLHAERTARPLSWRRPCSREGSPFSPTSSRGDG